MDFISCFRPSSSRRLLSRGGVVGAMAAVCFFSFSPSVWSQNLCAVSNPTLNSVVTNVDVTAANAAAAASDSSKCTSLEPGGICTAVTVQRVINASLGLGCLSRYVHAAKLSWTASTTTGATYNVYRAATSSGPFVGSGALNSSAIPCFGICVWYDFSVLAGQTWWYEVTAVAGGVESAPTAAFQAPTIPSTFQ